MDIISSDICFSQNVVSPCHNIRDDAQYCQKKEHTTVHTWHTKRTILRANTAIVSGVNKFCMLVEKGGIFFDSINPNTKTHFFDYL